MIDIEIKDNDTIAKIDLLKGKSDEATERGIRQAQFHVQGRISHNLADGRFGIKTRKGQLANSINVAPVMKIGNELVGIVGSNLKYARIQEVGGITHPTVTPKMRRFMWAKFRETGIEMFKWTAMTRKNRLDVKIPPHFYMRTTLQDESVRIYDIIRNAQKEILA